MTDETIRVLLVEDNPDDLQQIHTLLAGTSSVRFTWEHVEQLSAAKQILRTEPFDLILLDLYLTDSQGLDTLSGLFPHAVCLPIVILADLSSEPSALQALRMGAQDYLVKEQINNELLVQLLRQAIERKRTENALRAKIRELTVMAQQLESAVRLGHDLNSSLATINLSIESMLAQTNTGNRLYADLQMIREETNRMERLVANLLQLGHRDPVKISKADAKEETDGILDVVEYLRNHDVVPIHDEATYFFQALDAGTAGYAIKGSNANELMSIIHRIFQEGVLIPRTVGRRLLNETLDQIRTVCVLSYEQLSPREREIVRMIARGHTNKEIAKRLSISVRTVERHSSSVMNKLGLQNRAELIAFAVREGIVNGNDIQHR
jgi:DNA-binding NarL/FixJ family response regulator